MQDGDQKEAVQGGEEEEDVQSNDQMQQGERSDGELNGAPSGGEDMQSQGQMQRPEDDVIFGELRDEDFIC